MGLTPPLLRTRIPSWEKMKSTKGNIDLGDSWCTNLWTFGFQTPPAPPPPVKQNSVHNPRFNKVFGDLCARGDERLELPHKDFGCCGVW